MPITLFYSRFRDDMGEDGLAEYQQHAAAIAARSETFPGYISRKSYLAEDGERLTVVQFDSDAHQEAWRSDPVHRAAQDKGREKYYQEYRVLICEPGRESIWRHGEEAQERESQQEKSG